MRWAFPSLRAGRSDAPGRGRELSLLRCCDGLAVAVATVDPGLEAAANLLTRCEERVVVHAARRQLHDANGFVASAVAARVGGRLIERSQAIAVPPKPCHTRTPTTSRAPWEPSPAAGVRTLQTNCGGTARSAPGLARPRAPVATRRDEVPVGRGDLFSDRRAVPEESPLARAHLEQTEILAVLGLGAKT